MEKRSIQRATTSLVLLTCIFCIVSSLTYASATVQHPKIPDVLNGAQNGSSEEKVEIKDNNSLWDFDGDGYNSTAYNGTDCNDHNRRVYPGASEILDNYEDDDCDGWINTSQGYALLRGHPRGIISRSRLEEMTKRFDGNAAEEPYSSLYRRVLEYEIGINATSANPYDGASNEVHKLMDLAIMYQTARNQTFLEWYLRRLDAFIKKDDVFSSGDGFDMLCSVDIMWDFINKSLKLRIYELASKDDAFYYNSEKNEYEDFGYHAATTRKTALLFSVIFAYEDILNESEVINNRTRYSFNVSKYISIIQEELSPEGYYWNIENRFGGDMTYNSAIPGSKGGLFDNFGYDTAEDSQDPFLTSIFSTATGIDRISGFLRDRYRGYFYHFFEVPFDERMARVWLTTNDAKPHPNDRTSSLIASNYNDPYMQDYADDAIDYYNTTPHYYDLWNIWCHLLFYNNSLAPATPGNFSEYFSGPGLVSMRSGFDHNSTFAVFMCGDSFSRRYEDANTFIIGKKTDLIVQAGIRRRFQEDNTKEHWYHIRSISKNTIKVFDPEESFDVNSSGAITQLHSGIPLVQTDNMGGQLFSTYTSTESNIYNAPDDGYTVNGTSCNNYRSEIRSCSGFDLNICDRGDIIRYEHVPGIYTYSVGNGTKGYTRKIDYFYREFLYILPDTFIIFDRVMASNKTFRKSWNIHTVPEVYADQAPSARSMGLEEYINASLLIINDSKELAYISVLLPKQTNITVRGGDTFLTEGHKLTPSEPLSGDYINETDIFRWVEIFIRGDDLTGSLTLHGDAREGDNVTETITFTGRRNYFVSDYYGALSSGPGYLTVNNTFLKDYWKGYLLYFSTGGYDPVEITGNNETTLFFDNETDPSGTAGYRISLGDVANSLYHWKRIRDITTDDLEIDNIIVSVPHYYDALDARGKLHSFVQHTATTSDTEFDPSLGRYTVDIMPIKEQRLDNFLNVIELKDPGEERMPIRLIKDSGASGVLINQSIVVMFSNTTQELTNVQYRINSSRTTRHIILDLQKSRVYGVYEDSILERTIRSSDQGTLFFSTSDIGVHTYTIEELTNLSMKPHIDSIEGAMQNGEEILIRGNSFKSKSKAQPLRFDSFEGYGVGEGITNATGWWNTTTTARRNPSKISDEFQRHQFSHRNIKSIQASNMSVPVFFRDNVGFADTKKIFISLWVRWDWPQWSGGAQYEATQTKAWRVAAEVSANGDVMYPSIHSFNWMAKDYSYSWTTYNTAYYGGGSDQRNFPNDQLIEGQWQNFVLQAYQGTPGNYDGSIYAWLSKEGSPYSLVSKAGTGKMIIDQNGSYIDAIKFDNYLDANNAALLDAGYVLSGTLFWDDIYIDNSWARVEIGDNETYENCTLREMQLPLEWSDENIRIRLNQGAFANGSKAFIFVIDEEGNISESYQFHFEKDYSSCIAPADKKPCDSRIDNKEIHDFLKEWKSSMSISLNQLINAIELWKNKD